MLSSKELRINKDTFLKHFNGCVDLNMRDIKIAEKTDACILYIDTLVDKEVLNRDILARLLDIKKLPDNNDDVIKYITENIIAQAKLKVVELDNLAQHLILTGCAVLLIDGQEKAISLSIQGWTARPIQEPPTSVALKGPREGFTEEININISLIRRRLPSPELVIHERFIGKYTKTKVCVCYLEDIADLDVVKEIEKRLDGISIDGIIDSAYIQAFLEPKNDYIFKQSGSSERPDVIAAKMLEGRVAIIVNGSPVVITIPFILIEDFQNPDDYYNKTGRAVFVRAIRILGVIFSLFLPGLYVAVQLYHYKVIPVRFLITITNSTEGIPMTPAIEMLFVIILFEILYEASLRMPRYLGMALSIVGGIIIGDMVIQSGIASPPAIIAVALSGLTIYTVPDAAPQLFLLRLGFTLMGIMLGFLGIVLGIIFIIAHLATLDSYGGAYLSPWSPGISEDKQDAIFKSKTENMTTRPEGIPNKNKVRAKK